MVSKFNMLLLSTLFLISFTACEDTPIGSPVCTAEFVTITLNVADANGDPVKDADISVVHSASSDTLQVCEDFSCTNGTNGNYTIFHDGLMDETSIEGETFVVTGSAEEGSFSEEFVFAKDECHVYKNSGPDTITIN